MSSAAGAKPVDPRYYQAAVQGTLLTVGLVWLGFDLTVTQIAVTMATALAAQALAARTLGLANAGLMSALASSLSLCLLLRTNSVRWAAAAAIVAIGSKFLIRFRGKHIFNPSNIAIVALIAVTPQAWVSAGQWGSPALLAFFVCGLGMMAVTRAARADVTLTYLAAHAALLVARAWYLGDPMTIPLHRLQNGTLLLFAFAMISDPKTTPDSRSGRIVFACLVALVAYWVQNVLFRTNGPLWALAAVSPLVPIIDRLLPGPRYAWPAGPSRVEVADHETPVLAAAGARAGALVH